MSDLVNRIASQRNNGPLEGLMKRLPGFKGYEEMTERREADRMLRHHIVAVLKEQLTALVQAEKGLLTGGGLSYMSKAQSAKSKLQVFIDRINTAMPGYSGFYDAIKVGPHELDQIYAFDASLVDFEDKFRQKVADLQTAVNTKEGIDAAISALDALTVEANTAYTHRENVLTGLV